MSGVHDSVNPRFDVIAYDRSGIAKILVSSAQPYHGAFACARGFNARPAELVAYVVPVGEVENSPPPISQFFLTPFGLTEQNFCRLAKSQTAVRKTLDQWLYHFFEGQHSDDLDRAYACLQDAMYEHLFSTDLAIPESGSDAEAVRVQALRLSRADTLGVWRDAMNKLAESEIC